jgi:BirA family transcriptional regulator, biotin operon repressor / biotin---[acetyl-CoA-carboxylase] ligase
MYTSFDETPLEKIVMLLKSHQFEFLSGQEMSRTLGLSRAAVWKNIKKLQTLGYKIQSKRNTGYKLITKTNLLLPWEITQGLQTEILGNKIYYFETIDSTQDFALKLTSKHYENGSLIIAQKQIRGRGRLNRKWFSPKGGIWLSILLKPNFEIMQVSLFPMMTSLALAIAIEKVLRLKPKLKWPNDVMLNNKKVAGILVDASVESNQIDYIAIGVGINFKIEPKAITKLINKKGSEITTLVNQNQNRDPVLFLQAFLFELERLYNKLIANNIKEIKTEWEKRSSTLGKNVSVSTPSGQVKGKAIRLDGDGALWISQRGKMQRLLVGDVSYRI